MFRLFDKNWKSEGFADFKEGRIYDSDVARYAWKHLKWRDRFSFSKIVEATLSSFAIMSEFEKNNKDDWKFDF